MKRFISLILVSLLLLATLVSCQPAATNTPGASSEGASSVASSEPTTFDLALITDIGTINDKSFNQGAWEGLEKYAKEKSITYKYYQPSEKTTDAYVEAIALAVTAGAKIVVCPGYLFEPAIFKAQDLHPTIKFILLDGFPQDGTYTEFRIEDNVHSIFYAEEQSGFLAGYAAVKDGYKKLGFMGGMAVPAVVRFGYGFVQGADYAATELGLAKDAVEIKYHYLGNFNPDAAHQTMAAAWFNSGTEVIFAAAGGAGNSVMAAAEAEGKKVIGVDVDQSAESDTVITSAMKMLGVSVYDALAASYDGDFQGGKSVTLDVTVDGVGLPSDFSRFTTFKAADYDAIIAKLVADTDGIRTGIQKDTDADSKAVALTDITLDLVKVTSIE
ncbi:MAG: BMP family lipoprotein [Saccharofermentanales bacterium]